MPSREAQDRGSMAEQQRAEIEEQGLATPGVLEMMAVYEAAEKVYSTTISSTIKEPAIWFSTSTR